MKSRVTDRLRGRRIRVSVVIGACAAAIILPGHIFAEGVDDTILDAPSPSVAVDVAAVEPSYNPLSETSGSEPSRRDRVEYKGPAEPKPESPKASRPGLSLSQVERIRVRVWGVANLGGEYGIDADSSLSFPRVGRIEVGDMTTADLEQMLSAKLSELARAEVAVAVEVQAFRPYFIMGQVVDAGAHEWKPGLKVIQAISLARGVTRPSAASAYGGATGPMSPAQSQTRLTFALAQLERLKAERDGTDASVAADRISSLVARTPHGDRAALNDLIARQNNMLHEQRSMMETQLTGLREAREAAKRELQASEEQEKSVLLQLDSVRAQLENLEDLKNKRLLSTSRYLEQKNALLSAEISHANTRAFVERARSQLAEIEQQIILVPKQRHAALGERIEELEREVAQLRVATGGQGGDRDVMRLKYDIARETENGVQMIPATVFTNIMPGDVVIVADRHEENVAAVDSHPAPAASRRASSAEAAQRLIEDAAVEATPSVFRRTSASAELGRGAGRE